MPSGPAVGGGDLGMATRHEIFLTASPSVNQAREHLVRLSRLGGFASTKPVVIQTLKQNSTACRQAVAPGRDGGMAPVDFLSDEQVGAYGRFVGSSSELDFERFFFLDDDDRTIVGRRRGAANRLGFAVQLETVPNLGSFRDDPTAVFDQAVAWLRRKKALLPGLPKRGCRG